MVKKAQFSVEYLIIAAISFLIVTSGLFFLFSENEKERSKVDDAQLFRVGSEIIGAVNRIAMSGPPSKTTLQVAFPSNVLDVYTENSNMLVFEYESATGKSHMVFNSNTDLALDMFSFEQGIKTLVIRARDDAVLVCDKTIEHRCNSNCDISLGETPLNAPSDCCTDSCKGCTTPGHFKFCGKDGSPCYEICYDHNGCVRGSCI